MLLSSFPLISVCHCVNISNSFWYRNFDFVGTIWYTSRHLPLPGRHQEHRILRHPFPQRGVHNHFIDFAKLCLFCILFFSIATDLSENVIYLFYFNFI
jgi:hypothetical protein